LQLNNKNIFIVKSVLDYTKVEFIIVGIGCLWEIQMPIRRGRLRRPCRKCGKMYEPPPKEGVGHCRSTLCINCYSTNGNIARYKIRKVNGRRINHVGSPFRYNRYSTIQGYAKR
jgi:protein-arginine kinase activator protein McsA